MKATVHDIWDVVDQMVDENIMKILEEPELLEELDSTDFEELLEETDDGFEDEYLQKVLEQFDTEEDLLAEENGAAEGSVKDPVGWDPRVDNLNLWMQEFENILKDYVPEQQETTSVSSMTPLLMGVGGIFLLGLLTSAAVLIRIKRNHRRFRALPVAEEIVEEIVEPTPVTKNKIEPIPFNFFGVQLPFRFSLPLNIRRQEVG